MALPAFSPGSVAHSSGLTGHEQNLSLWPWPEENSTTWRFCSMNINAGTILDGTETVEQVSQRIFEKIISVAGGEKTRSELAGMGDEEFAPWQLGPVF